MTCAVYIVTLLTIDNGLFLPAKVSKYLETNSRCSFGIGQYIYKPPRTLYQAFSIMNSFALVSATHISFIMHVLVIHLLHCKRWCFLASQLKKKASAGRPKGRVSNGSIGQHKVLANGTHGSKSDLNRQESEEDAESFNHDRDVIELNGHIKGEEKDIGGSHLLDSLF